MPPPRHRALGRLPILHFVGTALWLLLAAFLHGADDNSRTPFNLAEDTAERSLKAFSEQSGRGVIFVTDAVKRVRTNMVKGNLTPSEALETLLRGTGLVCSHDGKTGAFAVRRETAEEVKKKEKWSAQRTTNDLPTNRHNLMASKNPRKL